MIDIPEPLYAALQRSADQERTSVPDLVLRNLRQGIQLDIERPQAAHHVELPLIRGAKSGPLMRLGANMNHVAFMSDEEIDESLAGR